MNNIKKVRQALDNAKDCIWNRKGYWDINDSLNTLDQFITDTENLIKENEELKKEHCKMCQSICSKNDIEMYCETCMYKEYKESENSND